MADSPVDSMHKRVVVAVLTAHIGIMRKRVVAVAFLQKMLVHAAMQFAETNHLPPSLIHDAVLGCKF
jgi:hypothetical protein